MVALYTLAVTYVRWPERRPKASSDAAAAAAAQRANADKLVSASVDEWLEAGLLPCVPCSLTWEDVGYRPPLARKALALEAQPEAACGTFTLGSYFGIVGQRCAG